MLYNIPVVPDEGLSAFVSESAGRIFSCHASLHSPAADDGRHRLEEVAPERLAAFLAALRVPRKYVLLNSRVHAAQAYFDPVRLGELSGVLDGLARAGAITGIVFADAYLLRALSDAAPDTAAQLEAVPSVNCQLDSWDKVAVLADFIASTGFKPPGALILDRSLNRRLTALAAVSERCRRELPGVALELLANEGCLDLCPFKPAHDCHISLRHLGAGLDCHRLNRDLGCIRELWREPWRLFASPFIRPEDAAAYEPHVDVLKLCGRTLGAQFIERTARAYFRGRTEGNLLDLLDAMEATAERVHVKAGSLPEDFLDQVGHCAKNCRACSYCRELYGRCASLKGMGPGRP
jgi:collagenase-like PrtC family protease